MARESNCIFIDTVASFKVSYDPIGDLKKKQISIHNESITYNCVFSAQILSVSIGYHTVYVPYVLFTTIF